MPHRGAGQQLLYGYDALSDTGSDISYLRQTRRLDRFDRYPRLHALERVSFPTIFRSAGFDLAETALRHVVCGPALQNTEISVGSHQTDERQNGIRVDSRNRCGRNRRPPEKLAEEHQGDLRRAGFPQPFVLRPLRPRTPRRIPDRIPPAETVHEKVVSVAFTQLNQIENMRCILYRKPYF